MLKHAWLIAAVALAGCPGEDSGPTVDGPPAGSKIFGATCTMVSDTNTAECDSGVCTDAFDMIGHPVCSQKCTPGDGSTCPVGGDGTKKCNMKGYCKP